MQSYKFGIIWSKYSRGCCLGLIKVKNLLSDQFCQGNATWNPNQGFCARGWVRGSLLPSQQCWDQSQAGQVTGEMSSGSLGKMSTTSRIQQASSVEFGEETGAGRIQSEITFSVWGIESSVFHPGEPGVIQLSPQVWLVPSVSETLHRAGISSPKYLGRQNLSVCSCKGFITCCVQWCYLWKHKLHKIL